MSDRRFYDYSGPKTIGSLLALMPDIHIPVNYDSDILIEHVNALEMAKENDLCYYQPVQKTSQPLKECQAKACLIRKKDSHLLKETAILPLITDFPRARFGNLLNAFYREKEFLNEGQPIHPTAQLGENVKLGYGCVIGADAEIGENSVLEPGVTIGPGCKIGPGSFLSSSSSVKFSLIGEGFVLGPNSALGYSGFAVEVSEQGAVDIPHIGRVRIGRNVSIGGGVMVDRGLINDTVMGENVKIDNLCQIAHNTEIGDHTIIAGMVGLAGSVKIGQAVLIGARSGVADHIHIDDGVRLAAASLVMNNIPKGETWGGRPARPYKEWMREMVMLRKLSKTK